MEPIRINDDLVLHYEDCRCGGPFCPPPFEAIEAEMTPEILKALEEAGLAVAPAPKPTDH